MSVENDIDGILWLISDAIFYILPHKTQGHIYPITETMIKHFTYAYEYKYVEKVNTLIHWGTYFADNWVIIDLDDDLFPVEQQAII